MNKKEFDSFADEYYAQHRDNVKLSGESPEFFAEYKIKTIRNAIIQSENVGHIFDFGCGVGNSIPHFRRYFPQAIVVGGDISSRSIALAQERFPGKESYFLLKSDSIPAVDASFDLVFTACVFHHISPSEHIFWLRELYRVTRPGGHLVIFEHNPYNPVTVHMVNTCPFDVNAKLIRAATLSRRLKEAGWQLPRCRYHLFFPHPLRSLRRLESWLGWLPLGGQYSLIAEKI
jgi:SAM-dependent methyltransferase